MRNKTDARKGELLFEERESPRSEFKQLPEPPRTRLSLEVSRRSRFYCHLVFVFITLILELSFPESENIFVML